MDIFCQYRFDEFEFVLVFHLDLLEGINYSNRSRGCMKYSVTSAVRAEKYKYPYLNCWTESDGEIFATVINDRGTRETRK